MSAYNCFGRKRTKETQMQNLGLQREQQLGHMWLGQLSVCSERGYSDRFEPTSALRGGIGDF
jgi:hypothetical protein